MQQYELLRDQALTPTGLSTGWGLVILLRSGMATWLQALLTESQRTEPAPSKPIEPRRVAALDERDWVLALTAVVRGAASQREARHG